MSYLGDYNAWRHAHQQAIYRRDHDAATRSRIVYAVTNDRLTRDTARHVFELIDDLRKSDAENYDRVSHILGMRPTAMESALKLKLEAAAPDLLAALEATLRCLEAHLDDDANERGLKSRDILCPCSTTEVVQARAAIAKAKGVTS